MTHLSMEGRKKSPLFQNFCTSLPHVIKLVLNFESNIKFGTMCIILAMASFPFAGLRDATLHKFCFIFQKLFPLLKFANVAILKEETHLSYRGLRCQEPIHCLALKIETLHFSMFT